MSVSRRWSICLIHICNILCIHSKKFKCFQLSVWTFFLTPSSLNTALHWKQFHQHMYHAQVKTGSLAGFILMINMVKTLLRDCINTIYVTNTWNATERLQQYCNSHSMEIMQMFSQLSQTAHMSFIWLKWFSSPVHCNAPGQSTNNPAICSHNPILINL